jgi:hypothetical protein
MTSETMIDFVAALSDGGFADCFNGYLAIEGEFEIRA